MAHAGRPTDYDPVRTIERAQAYLDAPRSEVVKIPTVEGLAIFLDVSRSTVYKWAEEHAEFSDIIEKLLTEQSQLLIENGLSGTYNSTITKLMLHKHGYKDRADLTSDDEPINNPDARNKAKAARTAYLNRGDS